MEAASRAPATGPDLFTAVGRNLVLFLLPILVLAGIGVAYGLVRKPQYKAEAKVSIGALNVSVQGLPGLAGAATTLSGAYARTIGAPGIAESASRAAGVSVQRARDALSAAAIPDTPLFRVDAEDKSKPAAIKMANAAAHAVIVNVLDLNKRGSLRDSVLTRYKRAARLVAALSRRVRVLNNKPAVVGVQTRLSEAQLRLITLAEIYKVAAAGEETQNLLQVVAPASDAKSDRTTTVERFGLIGALVGLLLGLALAAGRESRRFRRETAD
jgi:hypothetical protein